MGESKRRKLLDPNYGQTRSYQAAIREINSLSSSSEDTTLIIFTNKDKGCTEEEIKILKNRIPKKYENSNKKFVLAILPKKFANKPLMELLDNLVIVAVGVAGDVNIKDLLFQKKY